MWNTIKSVELVVQYSQNLRLFYESPHSVPLLHDHGNPDLHMLVPVWGRLTVMQPNEKTSPLFSGDQGAPSPLPLVPPPPPPAAAAAAAVTGNDNHAEAGHFQIVETLPLLLRIAYFGISVNLVCILNPIQYPKPGLKGVGAHYCSCRGD